MSTQLVLSVNKSDDGKSLADHFRWCWLGAGGLESDNSAAYGNREALRAALSERAELPQSAWVILPGSQVTTRQLEYSEKEKKHLRNLLPFQLEDSVVGDIDDLHFALATPADGKVAVAYADRVWMQGVFAELAALGIEVQRCWSEALLLPLTTTNAVSDYDDWTLSLRSDQLVLRYGRQLGFSVASKHGPMAIMMLLKAQERADNLPNLQLLAATEEELEELNALIPAELQGQIVESECVSEWSLDYSNTSIDLCQGEFSQRLPIERWWKLWRSVAIFAGVCALVYLGASFFEIHKLSGENLAIRQQIEAQARSVIPQGRLVDPEKQLSSVLKQMQPAGQSSSVMELLGQVLPEFAAVPSATIKGIAYTAETGDLSINVQADSFATFESIRQKIEQLGLNAELGSINAQGNVQSARLNIRKR
jgi:general secretion pathway protein L